MIQFIKAILQIIAGLIYYKATIIYFSNITYIQRGYDAIGSEYLLAIMVGISIYFLVGKMFHSIM